MAFVVVYDANVLYPAPLRDTMIRLAQARLFQAKWTEQILDECFEAIARDRPDLRPEALIRTRALMCAAVEDWRVTNYESLIPTLELPDPDDRHVLAAAVRAAAQVIVTQNIRDFPRERLEPLQIDAQTPDDFLLHVVDLSSATVLDVLSRQAAALKNPARSLDELMDLLAGFAPRAIARLRAK